MPSGRCCRTSHAVPRVYDQGEGATEFAARSYSTSRDHALVYAFDAHERTDLTALSRIGSVFIYASDSRQAVSLSMLSHLVINNRFGAAPSILSMFVPRTR